MKALALAAVSLFITIAVAACGDGGRDQSEGGQLRDQGAYEEIFDDLPAYPGARRIQRNHGNYLYPFADFSVPANPSSALSFYEQELPTLGWQALSGPTAPPTNAELQQQTARMFVKEGLTLTVYAHNTPPKGGQPGNIEVTLRLQER